MADITVGTMLERARDFEARLESFYADLRDRATRDGTRLLTYYLARHRRHLPEALDAFTPDQLRRLSHIPLKYDDTDFIPDHCFEGRELPCSVTGEELLEAAIELVETLTRFYRWMAQQPLGDEAVGLFQNLLRIEEKHVVELKKTKATHYF